MREEKNKNISRQCFFPFLGFRFFKNITCLGAIVLIILASYRAEAFVFQEKISFSKSLSHYAMGHIYDLLGMTKRAIFEYEKASQFDEASYLTHLRLGTDYARLNMLNEAAEELRRVNEYNADNLQSRYLLALIYSDQKKYDRAAEEYEFILNKFSKDDPKNLEIYGYLGQLYYSQRKYDKAIKQFENILELDSSNTDVMYLLGSLYLEAGEVDKSVEILKRSIATDPQHDGSLNTLAYLYAEEGRNLDEALDLINRALKILPDCGAYLDSKGWIYYKKGLYQKSLEFLLNADEILDDPVVYSHIGDVYHVTGQVDKAIKYWNLSLALLPNQKEIVEKLRKAKNDQAKQVETSK